MRITQQFNHEESRTCHQQNFAPSMSNFIMKLRSLGIRIRFQSINKIKFSYNNKASNSN